MADGMSWVILLALAPLLWRVTDWLRERRYLVHRGRHLQLSRHRRRFESVTQEITNHLGYLIPSVMSRNELEALVRAGMSPEALREELAQRCGEANGVILGDTPIGPTSLPVHLPEEFRKRHLYCIGKSGYGKTTTLQRLIVQDLHAGAGLGVVAPEYEMVDQEILPFIPEDRYDDVIVVNPADPHCPPLNPLHLHPGEDPDRAIDETYVVLQRAFGDESSAAAPRMQTLLRNALYALMPIPGTTLCDIPRLLDRADGSFREWVSERCNDEQARHFWRSSYSRFPRDSHLSLMNRLTPLLRPAVVRRVLCRPEGSLNMRSAMDQGKVVLFSLSDGILGQTNAEILGQLVVARIQLAAMSRADQPKEDRRPFTLYCDEFQAWLGVTGTSYERILSRARKYNLRLVLAHQQTGQIGQSMLREILGNVSTTLLFYLSASDARRLGKEMVGEVDGRSETLDPQELLSLRIGEAWCKIGRTVLYVRTRPPLEGGSPASRQEVLRRSRQLYGGMPSARAVGPDRTSSDDTAWLSDVKTGTVL